MEKTTISNAEKYNYQSYPSQGIFENKDEQGYIDVMVICNMSVWSLPKESIQILEKEFGGQEQTMISEKTLLKTIAVMNGNIENLNLNE